MAEHHLPFFPLMKPSFCITKQKGKSKEDAMPISHASQLSEFNSCSPLGDMPNFPRDKLFTSLLVCLLFPPCFYSAYLVGGVQGKSSTSLMDSIYIEVLGITQFVSWFNTDTDIHISLNQSSQSLLLLLGSMTLICGIFFTATNSPPGPLPPSAPTLSRRFRNE